MVCAVVCHTLYLFAHTALLAHVHCHESLVWLEASGFCYTISTALSLTETPFPYLVITQCHGEATALDLQNQPLHVLSS